MKRLMWFLGAVYCAYSFYGLSSISPVHIPENSGFLIVLSTVMFFSTSIAALLSGMLYCLYKVFFAKDK